MLMLPQLLTLQKRKKNMQISLLSLFYSQHKFSLSRGSWNPTIHFELEAKIG